MWASQMKPVRAGERSVRTRPTHSTIPGEKKVKNTTGEMRGGKREKGEE